ncbi:hypothetical protein FACS1894111_07130 [Clostridia bacterium]|nr:hypothetical protein FACS1894111_07130 [Clostridia bacterium]
MKREVYVYLFTGFMDSGKTSLIRQTLVENDFSEGGLTLLLLCEDGEEEYDQEKLAEANVKLIPMESAESFTTEHLLDLDIEYKPTQIFIEYNGTWESSLFFDLELPPNWELVQSLATVDAESFELYLSNMRTMMMEQFFAADVVIFNRCDEDTPRDKFRRLIKAKNRRAQIVYENKDGMVSADTGGELPYDLEQDVIDITDMDYGVWYLDALEEPKKYQGKKVRFLALVYHPKKQNKNTFIPGRFVMTCCADDITFLGFVCKNEKAFELTHQSWIMITAEIRVEFAKAYRGKGPVLYALSVTAAEKPAEDVVYFG